VILNEKNKNKADNKISLDERFGLVGLVHEKEEFSNRSNKSNQLRSDGKMTNSNKFYHK